MHEFIMDLFEPRILSDISSCYKTKSYSLGKLKFNHHFKLINIEPCIPTIQRNIPKQINANKNSLQNNEIKEHTGNTNYIHQNGNSNYKTIFKMIQSNQTTQYFNSHYACIYLKGNCFKIL